MYAIPAFLNDFTHANLSNPSSLQIHSQPVAEGAGGRGEALEYFSKNEFSSKTRFLGHLFGEMSHKSCSYGPYGPFRFSEKSEF